jgi:hypothetical protein
LARAQEHPAHRALHRVGTASVQGLLALTLPATRSWSTPLAPFSARCAQLGPYGCATRPRRPSYNMGLQYT